MPSLVLPARSVVAKPDAARRRCLSLLGACALGPATALAAVDHGRQYRAVGASHLYATYRDRIFRGRLPPLLYAIAITETEIDEHGRVVSAALVREPAAAKEVGPWVLQMIHAASPFPRPVVGGRLRYLDTWLVDRSYRFQLDTLTEGQD